MAAIQSKPQPKTTQVTTQDSSNTVISTVLVGTEYRVQSRYSTWFMPALSQQGVYLWEYNTTTPRTPWRCCVLAVQLTEMWEYYWCTVLSYKYCTWAARTRVVSIQYSFYIATANKHRVPKYVSATKILISLRLEWRQRCTEEHHNHWLGGSWYSNYDQQGNMHLLWECTCRLPQATWHGEEEAGEIFNKGYQAFGRYEKSSKFNVGYRLFSRKPGVLQ